MLSAPAKEEKALTPWKPILLFLGLAYGIAWIVWLPVLLGPNGLRLSHYDASIPLFVSLGTMGPLIASFLAVRHETGVWAMPSNLIPSMRLRSWISLLTAPMLTLLAFIVIPYMICVAPGHKLIALRFLAPLAGVWPNILGGPLEEEFGWRGYLLPRVTAHLGNTWATLIVGIIWASWHLPLIVYKVWAGLSFWYYLPLVVALAVFASLAYFSTGRSILGPIVLHYVFNTCSAMLGAAFDGQPRYSNRDVNEIILISIVCVALLTIAATRGRLGEHLLKSRLHVSA